jgi:hypothetical protein
VIQVISPTGQTATLSNRAGGNANNFIVTGLDISSSFTSTSSPSGQWRLFVQDLARPTCAGIGKNLINIAVFFIPRFRVTSAEVQRRRDGLRCAWHSASHHGESNETCRTL